MNNPIYVHFYSNGSFLYTKQLDTRIPLSELRSYLSFNETVQFLHQLSPIEACSEKDLKISDVLHSKTEVYLREMNTCDATDCVSECSDEITINSQMNLLNKKRKIRKFSKDKKTKTDTEWLEEFISPVLLSNWYKASDMKIKQVNFEIERKRFTSLIFNKDKTTKKISLNVGSLLGSITLGNFIKECMPLVEDFFNKGYDKSITKYLNVVDEKFVIEDGKM